MRIEAAATLRAGAAEVLAKGFTITTCKKCGGKLNAMGGCKACDSEMKAGGPGSGRKPGGGGAPRQVHPAVAHGATLNKFGYTSFGSKSGRVFHNDSGHRITLHTNGTYSHSDSKGKTLVNHAPLENLPSHLAREEAEAHDANY